MKRRTTTDSVKDPMTQVVRLRHLSLITPVSRRRAFRRSRSGWTRRARSMNIGMSRLCAPSLIACFGFGMHLDDEPARAGGERCRGERRHQAGTPAA